MNERVSKHNDMLTVFRSTITILIISFKAMPNVKKQITMAVYNKVLNILNGLHILYNKINPVRAVITTEIVDVVSLFKFKYDDNIMTNIILNTIVRAAGIDFLIMANKKSPFILSQFDSNAKTKEGIPIVNTLVKVNCIGENGYLYGKNMNNTANKTE